MKRNWRNKMPGKSNWERNYCGATRSMTQRAMKHLRFPKYSPGHTYKRSPSLFFKIMVDKTLHIFLTSYTAGNNLKLRRGYLYFSTQNGDLRLFKKGIKWGQGHVTKEEDWGHQDNMVVVNFKWRSVQHYSSSLPLLFQFGRRVFRKLEAPLIW